MTLERERIERLAIDQALGGLEPDVDALFTAYLKGEPASAQVAAAITDTAQLARRALTQGEPRIDAGAGPLPPFRADCQRSVARGPAHVMRLTRAAAAMAACLLAGSLRGAALARQAGVSRAPVPVVRQLPPAPPANDTLVAHSTPAGPLFAAPPRESAGSDLWSTRRLVAHAGSQQGRTSAPPALRWVSPAGLLWKEEQQ
jgi:hypothetical protein